MHTIAPIAPRVIPGRTIDILDAAPDDGVSRGSARVALDDPVFFDHPLDHVPGMLLAVAMLELAEHASMLDADHVMFRLTFTKFCELGAPVEVTAVRDAGGTHRLESIQSGGTIAKGLLAQSQSMTQGVRLPRLAAGPLTGELVHRVDTRNIAVGPLTVADGQVFTRIRQQGAIGGLPPRPGAIAAMLEAARQFAIAILHQWGGHPPGTKMIFVGLTAELPTAVPPGDEVRALSWQITSAEHTRKLHIDVHTVGPRATKVGAIVIAARCVNGDEYAQLRAG